jgi:hypothetical protein
MNLHGALPISHASVDVAENNGGSAPANNIAGTMRNPYAAATINSSAMRQVDGAVVLSGVRRPPIQCPAPTFSRATRSATWVPVT